MRVIFFGTADFAVPSLEQLVAHGHTIVMCATQPDRPQGRGLIREPSPVKQAALRLGLPLSQPERLHVNLFESLRPEVGVAVAYGQLIKEDLLKVPTRGMLGVHPSLLPKYRGAAPVAWALLNGEVMTGVTIFRLNERLDAGDIIWQQALAIEPNEDAQALSGRLAQLGAQSLLRALESIGAGRTNFTRQDESQASFAPKLTKSQGRIDWRAPAEVIERLVRATTPWPGAATDWHGGSLRVWRVSVGNASAASCEASPGTVVQVAPDALTVATGQGTLAMREVQPAGRRRMSVQEFLAGHPVHVGERLGGMGQEIKGGGRGAGDGGEKESP
jgi:methionyl-tRNA formyltransferase